MSFWTETGTYGVVHNARDKDPGSGRSVLMVFVHGIFGDCRGTWGNMPEWVLETAGSDADVVSFQYPAQLWERTSIPQAADDLKTWIETQFNDHRYLLFVTHSTGGLVVKHMLREAFAAIERQMQTGSFDIAASGSVWLRTRRIINIAVPHAGGSRILTGISRLLYQALLYPLTVPFLRLVRFLTQGARDWGRNDILPALRWRNPWLLALETEFIQQLQRAAALELPAPVIHDVFAKSDLSVPIEADPRERNIYFRGTHGSVKVPKHPAAPVVTIVSKLASRYLRNPALELVDRTLVRIAEVNRVTGVHTLIGSGAGTEPADERAAIRKRGGSAGTQRDVCDRVAKKLRGGSEGSRRVVITGMAGVGKSAVTRMVAWRLGRLYLDDPRDETPFPLLIPMQQINLAKEGALDENAWDALWAWWSRWALSLFPDQPIDPGWVEQSFRTRATAVILDGVDDFLVNHPAIGLSYVIAMLRNVSARYGDNRRFSVVVAIRSGFHGLERLASDPKDVHEVLRLSVAQAREAFPACRSWLSYVQDSNLLDLVLTPLILSNYEPDAEDLSQAQWLTPAAIMDQTIRTILRRSNLVGVRAPGREAAELDDLLYALSLIAWLFFSKHRGEVDTGVLSDEAKRAGERWEGHFRTLGVLEEAADVITGFRQVAEGAAAILQRTVFVSTGPNKVRFSHRSWQEFLLAQYFVLCLRWGNVEDFGVTAFNSHIYRMAGECFRGETITDERVGAVLDAWSRSGNTYITGNLIAFLAWTQTGIEPRALQRLLDELPRFEALSRVVLIAGLGYRVLVNNSGDLSVGDIRRALLPMLRRFSNPDSTPVDDAVASSLAWCYQKAFAGSFGMPSPETPWPEIGFSDPETIKALPMVCSRQGDQWLVDARSRSLQLAFLTPILDALQDPKLAIRAVHYLYYLVAARKHGVHILELSQELPQLLAPGCPFEQVIASFSAAPEVFTLYRSCQTLNEQLESGSA
ncbi:MAG: hypothetical protein M3436_08110 [Pseudomonadota bacterium]|nr:hypothetical protein [Pseudomonadota bacterium]